MEFDRPILLAVILVIVIIAIIAVFLALNLKNTSSNQSNTSINNITITVPYNSSPIPQNITQTVFTTIPANSTYKSNGTNTVTTIPISNSSFSNATSSSSYNFSLGSNAFFNILIPPGTRLPGGLILQNETELPSGLQLSPGTIFPYGLHISSQPKLPSGMNLPNNYTTKSIFSIPSGVILNHGIILANNTYLPVGLVLLSGTSFPDGLMLPYNTTLINSLVIPKGTVFPKGISLSNITLSSNFNISSGTNLPNGLLLPSQFQLSSQGLDFPPNTVISNYTYLPGGVTISSLNITFPEGISMYGNISQSSNGINIRNGVSFFDGSSISPAISYFPGSTGISGPFALNSTGVVLNGSIILPNSSFISTSGITLPGNISIPGSIIISNSSITLSNGILINGTIINSSEISFPGGTSVNGNFSISPSGIISNSSFILSAISSNVIISNKGILFSNGIFLPNGLSIPGFTKLPSGLILSKGTLLPKGLYISSQSNMTNGINLPANYTLNSSIQIPANITLSSSGLVLGSNTNLVYGLRLPSNITINGLSLTNGTNVTGAIIVSSSQVKFKGNIRIQGGIEMSKYGISFPNGISLPGNMHNSESGVVFNDKQISLPGNVSIATNETIFPGEVSFQNGIIIQNSKIIIPYNLKFPGGIMFSKSGIALPEGIFFPGYVNVTQNGILIPTKNLSFSGEASISNGSISWASYPNDLILPKGINFTGTYAILPGGLIIPGDTVFISNFMLPPMQLNSSINIPEGTYLTNLILGNQTKISSNIVIPTGTKLTKGLYIAPGSTLASEIPISFNNTIPIQSIPSSEINNYSVAQDAKRVINNLPFNKKNNTMYIGGGSNGFTFGCSTPTTTLLVDCYVCNPATGCITIDSFITPFISLNLKNIAGIVASAINQGITPVPTITGLVPFPTSPSSIVEQYNYQNAPTFITCPSVPEKNPTDQQYFYTGQTSFVAGDVCTNDPTNLSMTAPLFLFTTLMLKTNYNYPAIPGVPYPSLISSSLSPLSVSNPAYVSAREISYSPSTNNNISDLYNSDINVFQGLPATAQHLIWTWSADFADFSNANPMITSNSGIISGLNMMRLQLYTYSYSVSTSVNGISNYYIPFSEIIGYNAINTNNNNIIPVNAINYGLAENSKTFEMNQFNANVLPYFVLNYNLAAPGGQSLSYYSDMYTPSTYYTPYNSLDMFPINSTSDFYASFIPKSSSSNFWSSIFLNNAELAYFPRNGIGVNINPSNLSVALILSSSSSSSISTASCTAASGGTDAVTYFGEVLSNLGLPNTQNNINFLEDLGRIEGVGLKAWNPLDSEKGEDGSCNFNSAGVQVYPNAQEGAQATASTLGEAYYAGIRACLAQSAPLSCYTSGAAAAGIETWAGGPNDLNYIKSVASGATSQSSVNAWWGNTQEGGASGNAGISAKKDINYQKLTNPISITATPNGYIYVLSKPSSDYYLSIFTVAPQGFYDMANYQPATQKTVTCSKQPCNDNAWVQEWKNYWTNTTFLQSNTTFFVKSINIDKAVVLNSKTPLHYHPDTIYNISADNNGDIFLTGAESFTGDNLWIGKITNVLGTPVFTTNVIDNGPIGDQSYIPELTVSPSGNLAFVATPQSGYIYVINTTSLSYESNMSLAFSASKGSGIDGGVTLNVINFLANNGLYNASLPWVLSSNEDITNDFDMPGLHHPLGIQDVNGYLYVLDSWGGQVGEKQNTGVWNDIKCFTDTGSCTTGGVYFSTLMLRVINTTGSNVPISPSYQNNMYLITNCTNPLRGNTAKCYPASSASSAASQIQCAAGCTLEQTGSCFWHSAISPFTSNYGFTRYVQFSCVSDQNTATDNYYSLASSNIYPTNVYPPYGWILSANVTLPSGGSSLFSSAGASKYVSFCSSAYISDSEPGCTYFYIPPSVSSTPGYYANGGFGTMMPLNYHGNFYPIGPQLIAMGDEYSPDIGGFSVSFNGTVTILMKQSKQFSHYTELLFARFAPYNYTNIISGNGAYQCYIYPSYFSNPSSCYDSDTSSASSNTVGNQFLNDVLSTISEPVYTFSNPFAYLSNLGTTSQYLQFNSNYYSIYTGGASGTPSVNSACANTINENSNDQSCKGQTSPESTSSSLSSKLNSLPAPSSNSLNPYANQQVLSSQISAQLLVPYTYNVQMTQTYADVIPVVGTCIIPPPFGEAVCAADYAKLLSDTAKPKITSSTIYSFATAGAQSNKLSNPIEGGAIYIKYPFSNSYYKPNLSDAGLIIPPQYTLQFTGDRNITAMYFNISPYLLPGQQFILNASDYFSYKINSYVQIESLLNPKMDGEFPADGYLTISTVPINPPKVGSSAYNEISKLIVSEDGIYAPIPNPLSYLLYATNIPDATNYQPRTVSSIMGLFALYQSFPFFNNATTYFNSSNSKSIPATTIPENTSTSTNTTSANVLIVTTSSENTGQLTSALSNYESLLKQEGQTYNLTVLDSYNSSINLNSWESVKSTINKLESLKNPTYLIILGNDIPMPNLPDPPGTYLMLSGVKQTSSLNPNTIPTDDPYGSLTSSNIPTIVVSRIPGTPSQVATILTDDISRHSNNNNNLMQAEIKLPDYEDNFFQNSSLNTFPPLTNNLCTDNPNCVFAPSYCLNYAESDPACSNYQNLQNDLSSVYGIQYYACHGNGYSCSSYNITYLILSSSESIKFNDYPIIISSACFDGIYEPVGSNFEQGYNIPSGTQTLATAMLADGASIYIGNTREGIGPFTNTEEASIYNNYMGGETIGEAFLSMKQQYLTNPTQAYQQATAEELQLYGDPTISVSSLSTGIRSFNT
jgi:hypothetical protein